MKLYVNWIEFKILNWFQIHWMEFEFNWISIANLNSILIQLNSIQQLNENSIPIQLKRNVKQIGGKYIENLFLNMVLQKKTFIKTKLKKCFYMPFLLKNGLNIF
jgi:hypothetical protein